MRKPTWTVEHTEPNVCKVSVPITKPAANWEQWVLVRSDAHHDNAHTDWAMERRHLDLALQRNAMIVDVGDLHCAMQGKWDKRSDRSAMRPEYQQGQYLDRLVTCAADFYAPYAHNWLVMGRGNHETGILKNHETDLTERTVAVINARTGSNIQAGGYAGAVLWNFQYCTERLSKQLHYFHGSGGGGPVTKDMIGMNRHMNRVDGMDIIVSGHTHDLWSAAHRKQRLTSAGKWHDVDLILIKTGTYKDEYGKGEGGWATERGIGPKTLGAYWLRFTFSAHAIRIEEMRAT